MLNPSMFSIVTIEPVPAPASWSFSRSLCIRFKAALSRNAEVDMLATLQRIEEQHDQHAGWVLHECSHLYEQWCARQSKAS